MKIGMARADLDRMKHIRGEVERLLLPYRENTEAALVIGALLQICRILLVLYPKATREDLLAGIIPFLKGEQMEPEAGTGGIILPKGRIQ